MSTTLRSLIIVIKDNATKPSNVYGTSTRAEIHEAFNESPLFELPLSIKVQKAGFQNQEDGALLEKGGSASVRGWYTRTVLSKFAPYSMSTMLRQHIHRYQRQCNKTQQR
ncbi:MAG TPA: hypothetical protein IAA29_11460, partial [Candidatus Paenibacillus intestinavium]|nr:hypothetical protein [Candidatus Paenibacillus intestinavium]